MDDRFSARRGTYRIIYRIDDKNRTVTVVDVDHRRDVYLYLDATAFSLPNTP
jgi:mRNA-degrading endonuclease RelE of RelBE toxin-antitoxin system